MLPARATSEVNIARPLRGTSNTVSHRALPSLTLSTRRVHCFNLQFDELATGKENRPPRGMAPAGKNNTPGRRRRTDNHNQFFDVGKVGRKTGITLKDTGIRDEHGLEPVSGIFSSPAQNGDRTLTSEGMDVEEGAFPLECVRDQTCTNIMCAQAMLPLSQRP